MNTLVERALDFAEAGLAVFPCQGKIPLTKTGFKEATTDLSQVRDWWANYPNANIGIATGRTSSITVVDIDNKDKKAETRLASWPATLTVATPSGGFHLYYNYIEGLRNSVKTIDEETDIRNDGGYVVAPGSVGYSFIDPEHPITEFPVSRIPSAPAKKEVKPAGSNDIIEGGRNNYLTQLAGKLQRNGVTFEALSAALHAENEARILPPLDEREVDTIIRSVFRYDPQAPVEVKGPSYVSLSDELLSETLEYLGNKVAMEGEPTGIESFDKLLGGGLRRGELTVLNAPAKTGKSTLIHYIVHNLMKRGLPVGYASREMSPATEVMPNMLSLELLRNVWTHTPTLEELQLIVSWPLYFSAGYGTLVEEELERFINDLVEQGVQYFFIDHLHWLLENPEDFQEVSKIIKSVKKWTKEKNIHIFLVVQPPKLMDGQELGINTLRGGASLGQALDNLLTLQRVKDHRNICRLDLAVARHKMAEPGQVHLEYHKTSMKFEEVTYQEQHEGDDNEDSNNSGNSFGHRWPTVKA